MSIQRLLYLVHGIRKRVSTRPKCPACGSEKATKVDQKWVHQFLECSVCDLRYRYPFEQESKMLRFYQKNYVQKGLTTDLPDQSQLKELLSSKFDGTPKNLKRTLQFLPYLNISNNARVLDFGCSWGYAVWQFNQAGYQAEGFEISKPRADYGTANLGVKIHSKESDLGRNYDFVYSGHVLEHVPNPDQTLELMLKVLKPGGILQFFTPNGSPQRQIAQPTSFHRHWGQVHPVLLTEKFILRKKNRFERLLISSRDTFSGEDIIYDWNKNNQVLAAGELMAVGRKANADPSQR